MNGIGLFLITYNRLDYLKQSLEALESHNWGGADLIGVVDDGSTDGTQEFLIEYAKEHKISLILKVGAFIGLLAFLFASL